MTVPDLPNRWLQDPKLLVPGHFVGASGNHLDRYFNKKILPVVPKRMTGLCLYINDHFFRRDDFDAVAGPELGAVIPSFETTRMLEFYSGRDIVHLTVEKRSGSNGNFELTSGLEEFAPGRRFLLIEDVLTSGGSFIRTREAIERAGGIVVYGAVILNRSGRTAEDLGIKELFAVLELNLPFWTAELCPLCKAGVPINLKLGHGAAFVEKHGQPKAP